MGDSWLRPMPGRRRVEADRSLLPRENDEEVALHILRLPGQAREKVDPREPAAAKKRPVFRIGIHLIGRTIPGDNTRLCVNDEIP
ncbi:unnamed protein product, partial [marine sediment metagenome]